MMWENKVLIAYFLISISVTKLSKSVLACQTYV